MQSPDKGRIAGAKIKRKRGRNKDAQSTKYVRGQKF